jgi:hypothetical protein
MFRIRQITLALSMAMASMLFASTPEFQSCYRITGVNGTTNSWRITGDILNTAPLGFGASDATNNDLVFCYCSNGDIDVYRVTNIVSVSFNILTCDVVYHENGTPRAGQPQAGYQIISRTNVYGVAYLPSLTFDPCPEYLQNGARNINLKVMMSNLTETTVSKKFVMTYVGEQTVNAGSTILPYSNVRVANTNTSVIALGNPQIQTNGVSDGAIMYLRGASTNIGIQITNGAGVLTDCNLGFLLKSNDVMQLVFMSGQWAEIKRVDQ